MVPTISIAEASKHPNVHFYSWKAHKDWVTDVHYSKELHAIIRIGCAVRSRFHKIFDSLSKRVKSWTVSDMHFLDAG